MTGTTVTERMPVFGTRNIGLRATIIRPAREEHQAYHRHRMPASGRSWPVVGALMEVAVKLQDLAT